MKDAERKYRIFNVNINERVKTLNDANQIIKDANVNDYYNDRLNVIKRHFKRNKEELNDTETNIIQITDNLESLLDDIHVINVKLMDLMTKFDNFGKTNVSTYDAIKNGLKTLDEIKTFSKSIDINRINDVLIKCNVINNETLSIYNRTMIDTRYAKDHLRLINVKLNDLENLTNKIKFNITSSKTRNDINKLLIDKLNDDFEMINHKYENINNDLKEIEDFYESNVKYLNEIEKLHDIYRDMNIDDLLKRLRDEQDDFEENLSILEEQVTKASNHTEDLKEKVKEYKR